MKTRSLPFAVRGGLVLFVLFAVGSLVGSALVPNLPPVLVGSLLALLGLRLGAAAAAAEEAPAAPRPLALAASDHGPTLRAANG